MEREKLIEKLKSIQPSEGKWDCDGDYIEAPYNILYKVESALFDDDRLVELAPTMRLEIFAMAKEIEELRSQLSLALRDIRSLTP